MGRDRVADMCLCFGFVERPGLALGFAPDHTYPHFMHVLSPKSLRVRHFGHVWNSIAAACSCPCASDPGRVCPSSNSPESWSGLNLRNSAFVTSRAPR